MNDKPGSKKTSSAAEAALFPALTTVKYKDASFECEISSNDTGFVTETLDNLFNQQGIAKRLEDILTGVEVPEVVKEKLKEVFSIVKQGTDEAKKAVEENTPTT